MVVRPAVADDYVDIARLTVAAYRADGQLASDHGYDAVLADVAGRAEAAELLVAVATTPSRRRVVGAVAFVLPGSALAELAGPGEAEFRMLAVDPTAQGLGVGRALVAACADRARSAGARALVIYVRDFATRAQRLYAGLAFARTPARDWSPFPAVTLLALRKDLPSA
ncbi:GNAT family N-acetyltransferase [Luedemannella flava]